MTTTAPRDEQLWARCDGCASLLYRKRLRRNLDVCPECGSHARLDAPERVLQLADPESFTPLPERAVRIDPIGFVDALPYPHRLSAARAGTGLDEAVLCGTARIGVRDRVRGQGGRPGPRPEDLRRLGTRRGQHLGA
ncbi:hypothetical protein ACWEVO_33895, partial [Micromonospora sp. NPDC003776]